jgi:alkylation response protein AidB-like acyl-CoA dehydrogenase
MHFGLTEEQQQLQESVRDYLGQLPNARAVLEGADPEDRSVWNRIVEEQGWQAIVIAEEDGGFGFSWVELSLIFEELGRSLTPCPLLGTALATAALSSAEASETRAHTLQAIAGGAPAALALGTTIQAEQSGNSWTLNGTADQVVDGMMAESLIVETSQGFFLVTSADCQREALNTLDISRPMARIHLDQITVPLASLLTGISGDTTRMIGESLIAAEAVGAAEACLELAVEYAKCRKQFGKAIGSFQAIQHKAADMMVAVESARSAAWYAAWAISNHSEDGRLAARTAKSIAGDALFLCAGDNIQIHGGIGFTWEHDAHLYFKRAQASLELLGRPSDHREAIATALLGAL